VLTNGGLANRELEALPVQVAGSFVADTGDAKSSYISAP
jgi:hypothetical protein